MIDWIAAVVPCTHHDVLRGGCVYSVDADGHIEWETNKGLSVEGSYSAKTQVKTDSQNQIYVSGNPSKFLQGHNLFGSNSPRKLVYAFLDELTKRLRITPSFGDRLRWRSGHYQVKRIDIAECFRLPTTADVDNWIRAASPLVRGKHQQVSAYGGETIYVGQRSRRISLKIYNKSREIKKHPLHPEIPHRRRLLDYAEGLLRAEVCIRSQELKRRDLNMIENWESDTASEILRERIGRLEMPEKMRLTSTEVEELPPRLKGASKLWESGHDLRTVYPKATFYRYRNELRKYGIDISVPPNSPSNVIPLVRFLEAEHEAQVPDWAIGTSLIACGS